MSNKKNQRMVRVNGDDGPVEKYIIGQGFGVATDEYKAKNTDTCFNEPTGGDPPTRTLLIGGVEYEYVMWGVDDQAPYKMRDLVHRNMITSQCQLYNMQSTYGQGLRYHSRETGAAPEFGTPLWDDIMQSNPDGTFLKMCMDIKMYYFAVAIISMSRDGETIVDVIHKEAQNCRITKDWKYLLFGDFEDGATTTDNQIAVYPLLDPNAPMRDFLVKTGKIANPNTGVKEPDIKPRFAMIMRVPTVGYKFYPIPTYMSVFHDKWYDIYSLIGYGKREKIRNSAAPRFQIEIDREYWDSIFVNEKISDPVKMAERIKKEKEDIEAFVCGIGNSGKTWITGTFVDPTGKDHSMVKITNLEAGKKEGGDWADDIQEASNILCFAFGCHPNLIGATPGKTAMNNSGSDKRELFTMKQCLDTLFRDTILLVFKLKLYYNGYAKEYDVDVPIAQLTTLDENKDVKQVTKEGNDGDTGN